MSRNEELVATCHTCHTFLEDESSGLGPNLWGVVGRKVAGQNDFAYSDALRRIDSDWSKQTVKQFLLDPQAYAPGTAMQRIPMTETEADEIVDFLANLRD